jgi:uncharacterized iron-regulated protein
MKYTLLRCLPWLFAGLLAACASGPGSVMPPGPPALPAAVAAALPADIVLLGEQHDAQEHPKLHLQTVQALAARQQLAAVVLEMAEQGVSTADLPANIDEAAVRSMLRWDEAAWPWEQYGPVVMAAVRAGVPVLGGNLPRKQVAQAMRAVAMATRLPAPALARQREAIRAGHCSLLPEAQVGPMARVQIARDRAMAWTLTQAAQEMPPGRVVLLVAGSGHVDLQLGVPQHLTRALRARAVQWPAEPARRDYCADLKRQMGRA